MEQDRRIRTRNPLRVAASLVASCAVSTALAATTFTVNTTSTVIAVDGFCSISEAFLAINTQATVNECTYGTGPYTINLPAGTISLGTLGSNDPNFGKSAFEVGSVQTGVTVTVNGGGTGTTLNVTSGAMRHFLVPFDNRLDLNNVTLSGGVANDVVSAYGVFGGSIIVVQGTVNLNEVTISGNFAESEGMAILGVGSGTHIVVYRSTIANNTTTPPAFNVLVAAIRGDQQVIMDIANSTFDGSYLAMSTTNLSTLNLSGVTVSTSMSDSYFVSGNSTAVVRDSLLGGWCTANGTVTTVNSYSGFASCSPAGAMPTLLALALNGGVAKTMLPVLPNTAQNSGGACVFAGTSTTPFFTGGNANTTDQRNVTRNNCDAGAVEMVLDLTPTSLPGGTVGAAYSQTFTGVNGSGFYAYTIATGSVPGLTLGNVSGTLGGTATSAGTHTFVVRVDDTETLNAGARSYSIVIAKADQTISFGANPGPVTFAPSGTFAVSATGGASGNPVTFTSQTTGVCTIAGSTVTMVTAGTCTIAADQAGNANYNAAPQVTQNITINPANQTISFGANPGPVGFVPSGTFAVSASGGASGNPVTFTSLTTGVCTIAGSTVTMIAAGTCTIAANQAGNTSYNAAAQVTQDITINPGVQNIDFPPPSPGSFVFKPGATFSISPPANASSGLAIVYASLTPGVCTVSGSTVTMVAVGSCVIEASQPGSADFLAAAPVTRTFAIVSAGVPVPALDHRSLALAATLLAMLGALGARRRRGRA